MKVPDILLRLGTKKLGRDLVYLDSVDSTSEEIKRILFRSPRECVVVAGGQTAARGRGSNRWFSPPGENLYFSMSLEAGGIARENLQQVSAVLGVAIHRAAGRYASGRLTLKWPNDLLLEEKKLAGILCEVVNIEPEKTFVVAGIGLNVNTGSFPPEICGRATSLLLEEKRTFSREEVLASALDEIEQAIEEYREKGMECVVSEYRRRCSLWGRRVLAGGMEGFMKDISPAGGLMLETADGSVREIFSGSVELLDKRHEGHHPP